MNAVATNARPALTTLAHEIYSAFAWANDLEDYSVERAIEIFELGTRAVQIGEIGADLHAIVADLYEAFTHTQNELTFAFQDGLRRAERLFDIYAETLVIDDANQLCITDGEDLYLADAEQIAALAA